MGNKKKNVAFLFGAGAEKPVFNLPNGFEFLKNTLFLEDFSDRYGKYLGDRFSKENYFENYKYRKNFVNEKRNLYKLMLEKICFVNEIKVVEKGKENINEKKIFITDDDVSEFKTIVNLSDGEFSKYSIKSENLKEILGNYKKISYAADAGIAGILDGYFHTIINPTKFSIVNFSKIFNYYWCCYFVILEAIFNSLEKENLLSEKLKEYKNTDKLDYERILSNIKDFTQALYECKDKISENYKNSYYAQIKEALAKKTDEIALIGVATTNYFLFPKILANSSLSGNELIYLNGKLSVFEFPEVLEIHDFNCDNDKNIDIENQLFFPFIFGQSYLKPIVNKIQIDEFKKFENLLKESNVLVILGFNINEDDNHINSFLHEFVKKNTIIFVSDKKEDSTIYEN